MKTSILSVLVLGMIACGGRPDPEVSLVDSDSGWICQCSCNPLTQGACNPGEKCTWINDQDRPPIGHIGCAPDPGTAGLAIGSACTEGQAGPMGYDTCVKGAICASGVCKQICDQAGGAPTCDQVHACAIDTNVFSVGGTIVAGVCDPGCNPLTQDLEIGTVAEACGSPTPTLPTRGCYGYADYACAAVEPAVLALTDRTTPRTNAAGNPLLNGCAPGFIPLLYETTGSTVMKCTGLCAALEVDNTTIGVLTPAQREDGDVTAVGKLPTTAKAPGDATCAVGKKGSQDSSMCKFLWPYLADRTTGELPSQFAAGPYLDTLGVCQAVEYFDAPNCRDLPRLTADPMDEDAAKWGCQKFSSSHFIGGKPVLAPALSNIRIPTNLAIEVLHHNLE